MDNEPTAGARAVKRVRMEASTAPRPAGDAEKSARKEAEAMAALHTYWESWGGDTTQLEGWRAQYTSMHELLYVSPLDVTFRTQRGDRISAPRPPDLRDEPPRAQGSRRT